MKAFRKRIASPLAVAMLPLLLGISTVLVAQETSLIKNREFKMIDERGVPAGWSLNGDGACIITENGVATLSLKTTELGSVSATQEITLDPSWATLHFSYRFWVKAITPGVLDWNDARIALTFIGPDEKVTHMIAGSWQKPTSGWSEGAQNVAIPPGATTVKVSPAIFDAVGEWELRDLRVVLAAKRNVVAAPGMSLIQNSEFKMLDVAGVPAAWSFSGKGVRVVTEDGMTNLSLKTTETASTAATQTLMLDPSWKGLRFTYQVRVNTVTPGKLGWNDARIALTFRGPDETVTHMVAGTWKESTNGWVSMNQEVAIPPGATQMNISLAIFDAVAEWSLRNLHVELTEPQ